MAEGGWAAVCADRVGGPGVGRSPGDRPASVDDEDARALVAGMREERARSTGLWRGRAAPRSCADRAAGRAPPRSFGPWQTCRATPRAFPRRRRCGAPTSGSVQRRMGSGRSPAPRRRLRHRLRLRRARLPAGASSSRRSTTVAPTNTVAHSRTVRASGARRSKRCGKRSGRCAIAARIGVDPWVQPGRAGRGAGIHPCRRSSWSICGMSTSARLRRGPWLGSARRGSSGPDTSWSGRRSAPATAKPIVGVGRLTDPEQMAAIDPQRRLDLVGAARPRSPTRSSPQDRGGPSTARFVSASAATSASSAASYRASRVHAERAAGEEYRRGWHPEHFAPAPNRTGRARRRRRSWPVWSARSCSARGSRGVHLVDADVEPGGSRARREPAGARRMAASGQLACD